MCRLFVSHLSTPAHHIISYVSSSFPSFSSKLSQLTKIRFNHIYTDNLFFFLFSQIMRKNDKHWVYLRSPQMCSVVFYHRGRMRKKNQLICLNFNLYVYMLLSSTSTIDNHRMCTIIECVGIVKNNNNNSSLVIFFVHIHSFWKTKKHSAAEQ